MNGYSIFHSRSKITFLVTANSLQASAAKPVCCRAYEGKSFAVTNFRHANLEVRGCREHNVHPDSTCGRIAKMHVLFMETADSEATKMHHQGPCFNRVVATDRCVRSYNHTHVLSLISTPPGHGIALVRRANLTIVCEKIGCINWSIVRKNPLRPSQTCRLKSHSGVIAIC